MKGSRDITSRDACVLPLDDIDTDQIIPARFLKTTDRRASAGSLRRLALRARGPAAAAISR